MEVDAGDVVLEGGGTNVVGGARGEMTDLYCGLHRPREYAALFAWHPLETCCHPGVQVLVPALSSRNKEAAVLWEREKPVGSPAQRCVLLHTPHQAWITQDRPAHQAKKPSSTGKSGFPRTQSLSTELGLLVLNLLTDKCLWYCWASQLQLCPVKSFPRGGSSFSICTARWTIAPRTAYSTRFTLGFMLSKVSTLPLLRTPFAACWDIREGEAEDRSARALSFSSGGSPLAGVKYTWLEGSSSKEGGSGGGGAGYLLSLAAARWRFRSASVWCDFSLVILSAPSPSVDPDPDAGLSWYEALRSMRPPPVHSSPGTEEDRETEVPPLPRLDMIFLSAASSSSKRDAAPPPAT
ncbi:hypothetical protein FQN60_013809 [Etheostoma spectabile]|uniref:Uncharacterized protein n=1 Tax=Etheostoma spectabile TaxID=54343 RepID=A0A5J5CL74_9PERO|nr:hypothetical protein FQN60_013809 [Etheostoma spectabile]